MDYPAPKLMLDEMEVVIAGFAPKAPHDGYAIIALQEACAGYMSHPPCSIALFRNLAFCPSKGIIRPVVYRNSTILDRP